MNYNDWRAAITALAGAEAARFDAVEIRTHAASCATCRQHRDAIILGSALQPRRGSSELAQAIVKTARRLDRAAIAPVLRAASSSLRRRCSSCTFPNSSAATARGVAEHPARRAAACPVAYAIGLVVVAMRPSRARGFLAVTAALAAALVITAAVDISRGVTPILAEAHHVTEIAGVLLVWLNARRVSHPIDATRPAPPATSTSPAPDRTRPPYRL